MFISFPIYLEKSAALFMYKNLISERTLLVNFTGRASVRGGIQTKLDRTSSGLFDSMDLSHLLHSFGYGHAISLLIT